MPFRKFSNFRKFSTLNIPFLKSETIEFSSTLAKCLGGAGILVLGNGLFAWRRKVAAENEIERRKAGLKKPLYVLEGDELVNFPWNKDNIDEWYFRPVRIKGRFDYGRTMPEFADMYKNPGAYAYTPLITKEDENLENRSGIVVMTGFYPGTKWGNIVDNFRTFSKRNP